MVITYDGVESVKITQGDMTIAFNPPSKKSKFAGTSFGSDVVLITADHPDLNGFETATRSGGEPFVVNGPGEYEVKGLFIKGFATTTNYGGSEKINTIYSLQVDNANIVFLGAMADKELPKEIREEIGEVDILFVPIGGEGVLNAIDAYGLAVKVSPSAIIPIHYGQIGAKDALKKFLKEGGQEDVKATEKLTVKKKELAELEGDIIVLKN